MTAVHGVDDRLWRYKKYLEDFDGQSSPRNNQKLMIVLSKLDHITVNLELLRKSGIGKVVNAFRKHEEPVGDKARTLVSKWKRFVQTALEYESQDQTVDEDHEIAPNNSSVVVEPNEPSLGDSASSRSFIASSNKRVNGDFSNATNSRNVVDETAESNSRESYKTTNTNGSDGRSRMDLENEKRLTDRRNGKEQIPEDQHKHDLSASRDSTKSQKSKDVPIVRPIDKPRSDSRHSSPASGIKQSNGNKERSRDSNLSEKDKPNRTDKDVKISKQGAPSTSSSSRVKDSETKRSSKDALSVGKPHHSRDTSCDNAGKIHNERFSTVENVPRDMLKKSENSERRSEIPNGVEPALDASVISNLIGAAKLSSATERELAVKNLLDNFREKFKQSLCASGELRTEMTSSSDEGLKISSISKSKSSSDRIDRELNNERVTKTTFDKIERNDNRSSLMEYSSAYIGESLSDSNAPGDTGTSCDQSLSKDRNSLSKKSSFNELSSSIGQSSTQGHRSSNGSSSTKDSSSSKENSSSREQSSSISKRLSTAINQSSSKGHTSLSKDPSSIRDPNSSKNLGLSQNPSSIKVESLSADHCSTNNHSLTKDVSLSLDHRGSSKNHSLNKEQGSTSDHRSSKNVSSSKDRISSNSRSSSSSRSTNIKYYPDINIKSEPDVSYTDLKLKTVKSEPTEVSPDKTTSTRNITKIGPKTSLPVKTESVASPVNVKSDRDATSYTDIKLKSLKSDRVKSEFDESHDKSTSDIIRSRTGVPAKVAFALSPVVDDDSVNSPRDSEDEGNVGSFEDFLNYDANVAKLKKLSIKRASSSKTLPVAKKIRSSDDFKPTNSKSSTSSSRSENKSGTLSSSSSHKTSKHASDNGDSRIGESSDTKRRKTENSSDEDSYGNSNGMVKKEEAGSTSNRGRESLPFIPRINVTTSEVVIPKPSESLNLTEDDFEIDPSSYAFPTKAVADDNEEVDATAGKHNARTAVFSGRRNKQIFLASVPTLMEAALNVVAENFDELGSVYPLPYEIFKSKFELCTPNQLYNIENHNPLFINETDKLWERHCKRDFYGCALDPESLDTWRELYLRNDKERGNEAQKKLDLREAKLKEVSRSIALKHAKVVPVRATKLAYVDSVVKPPREVRRSQVKNNTAAMKRPIKTAAPVVTRPLTGFAQQSSSSSRIDVSAKPSSSRPDTSNSRSGSFSSKPLFLPPTDNYADPTRKAVKVARPLMQKTLKFMKNMQRR